MKKSLKNLIKNRLFNSALKKYVELQNRIFVNCYSEPVFTLNGAKQILIIAPHPDDETIGCSSILLNYSDKTTVFLLTDGSRGIPNMPPEQVAEIRKNEFKQVMLTSDIKKYKQFNIPDSQLMHYNNCLDQTNLEEFDAIFVPHLFDKHTDHFASFELILKAIREKRVRADCLIFMYEIWTPLLCSNYHQNISTLIDRKVNLIDMYKSQTAIIDYTNGVRGLNEYRGMQTGCEYAEAFHVMSAGKFSEIFKDNIDKIKKTFF